MRTGLANLLLVALAAYLPAIGYEAWSFHHPRVGQPVAYRWPYRNHPVLDVVLRPAPRRLRQRDRGA